MLEKHLLGGAFFNMHVDKRDYMFELEMVLKTL